MCDDFRHAAKPSTILIILFLHTPQAGQEEPEGQDKGGKQDKKKKEEKSKPQQKEEGPKGGEGEEQEAMEEEGEEEGVGMDQDDNYADRQVGSMGGKARAPLVYLYV